MCEGTGVGRAMAYTSIVKTRQMDRWHKYTGHFLQQIGHLTWMGKGTILELVWGLVGRKFQPVVGYVTCVSSFKQYKSIPIVD